MIRWAWTVSLHCAFEGVFLVRQSLSHPSNSLRTPSYIHGHVHTISEIGVMLPPNTGHVTQYRWGQQFLSSHVSSFSQSFII
ncbi:hypothetical protein C8Q80DRAFT_1166651 [Daedaleopsis nitida]|nr:hypothetical protein C8Q80DRAFT_1166651 [Daedaleopsis nitida]